MSPSLFLYFVMSLSLFRYGTFVISLFRYGAFVMSPRNNEKTKWHKSATIYKLYLAKNVQLCLGTPHLNMLKIKLVSAYLCYKIVIHFVQYRYIYIYIFQYVTQHCTFTRLNALHFIIFKRIPMYTLVTEVHVQGVSENMQQLLTSTKIRF